MSKLVTAAAEYAKDSKLKPEDVVQLREWLRKQPHLPQQISEEFLISVLHSSEYSVEQAKQLLESNISCRSNYPEMFLNRDPLGKDKLAVWKFLDVWIGPEVTEDKYRIVYIGLHNFDPELFDFPATINVCFSILDALVGVQGVCPGYAVILNAEGVTFSHLAKASISYIRNVLYYVQEAICIKIKEIHVINVSPVVDKVMFIAKPFLKKELLDMLYFHSGEMEDFYKAVPKDLLPNEIGGVMGSKKELVEASRDRIEGLRQWLIDLESLRIEDSKRTNNKGDVYSVAGSFRKLDLD